MSDVYQVYAFYERLNQILDDHKFDLKVERIWRKFYGNSQADLARQFPKPDAQIRAVPDVSKFSHQPIGLTLD